MQPPDYLSIADSGLPSYEAAIRLPLSPRILLESSSSSHICHLPGALSAIIYGRRVLSIAYMRIHPQLHFHRKTILWPGAIATAPDIALDITKNSNVDFIYKRVCLSFGLLQTSLLIFPLSHNLWATKPLSLSLSLSLHSLFSYPLGWHFKTGTFGVFTCQKMALRAPQSKNGVQKPRETPPKMVG